MNVSCAIKTAKRSPLCNRRYELCSHLRDSYQLRMHSERVPQQFTLAAGRPLQGRYISCTRSRGAQAYPWLLSVDTSSVITIDYVN